MALCATPASTILRNVARGPLVASRRLIELLLEQPSLERSMRALQLWPPEFRHGGFCSPPDPGSERWHAHAFILFADGSIGDCTSDQFGGRCPRLAWTADTTRYVKVGSRPM